MIGIILPESSDIMLYDKALRWCEANCAGRYDVGSIHEKMANGRWTKPLYIFHEECDATLFEIWVAGR